MKTLTEKFVTASIVLILTISGLVAAWWWYVTHYVHQHCIVVMGSTFMMYAQDHAGRLPYSTNGFGDALSLLVRSNYLPDAACICAPGDDGSAFTKALLTGSVLRESDCSRVYIQGLSETNDLNICVLFDRNSCRGGDHMRSPWGHRLRETLSLGGTMSRIPDETWPAFSRQQVNLLITAGFSTNDALRFYPEATNAP